MKMDGSVFEEKSSFKMLGWLSPLNWIGAFTLSLLIKLCIRKSEFWFVIWNFHLRLLCISVNLPYGHAWNTVVMFGLVPLNATWNWITLVDVLLNWQGGSTRYSDRLHDSSVTVPRCCKDVYVNSFFPRATRLRLIFCL